MSEQQPSPILGLNFLQDVKAEPTAIAGAYDPEQEVWATLEQVQGGVSRELPRSLSNIRQGSSGQRLGAKPTERYTSDMDGNSDVSHD